MKRRTAGKLGKDAPIIGSRVAGQEPPAKPSPKRALASGKPQFTPGPWSAYDRGIGWEVRGPLDGRINDEFRDTFTDADAHLIAAAPEMYAALEALLLGVEEYSSAVQRRFLAAATNKACRALAKARGEIA